MRKYQHTPVMLKEVLEYLNPRQGQYFIDCTLGGAGYTMAIAKKIGPVGKMLAIDLDELAIKNAELKIKNAELKNIILTNDNFKNLSKIVKTYFKGKQIAEFNGIVFDLGLSSAQLQDRDRGFSFQLDGPLDMRFGNTSPLTPLLPALFDGVKIRRGEGAGRRGEVTAESIVNYWKREELEKIIRKYGEERFAKRIAQGIVDYRKNKLVKTTGQLVEIIKSAIPKKYQYGHRRGGTGKIHPATRTFQALRIAANNELKNLREVLPQAADLLAAGGKIVVISYHSLEDRIVKQFFKQESKDCICPPDYPICSCKHKRQLKILTKKVVRAEEEEIRDNPRARSAKMRVAEKL